MSNVLVLTVLVLVFAQLCLSESMAYLAVQKQIDSRVLAADSNSTITIKIFNLGSAAAHDIRASDDWPLEHFDIVSGDSFASFDLLEPSAHVEYSFTIVPKSTGTMRGFPALVSYRTSPDASPTSVSSSVRFPEMQIISKQLFDRYTNTRQIESSIFYAGVFLCVFIPSLYQFYYSSHYVNGFHKDLFSKSKQN